MSRAHRTSRAVALKARRRRSDELCVDVQGILNEAELLERVGGDVEFLREIASMFLEQCPRMVDEIRRACDRGDAEALQHTAHTLKGCVANFGAGPAREAAYRLEKIGRSGDLSPAPAACSKLEGELARFIEALSELSRTVSA